MLSFVTFAKSRYPNNPMQMYSVMQSRMPLRVILAITLCLDINASGDALLVAFITSVAGDLNSSNIAQTLTWHENAKIMIGNASMTSQKEPGHSIELMSAGVCVCCVSSFFPITSL